MRRRQLFFIIASSSLALACSSAPPPPPAQPPPPAPPPPKPAPEPPPPEPAPAPAPARDERKDKILGVLDQIEAEARAAEDKKMHHITENAHNIKQLTESIAEPISHYPSAASPYATLDTQAHKLHHAVTANKHQDAHHHVAEVRAAVAATRTALQ